jgi:hypothetical protein
LLCICKDAIGLLVVCDGRDGNHHDGDTGPFDGGSLFTCNHFTPVKTSLRRWSRKKPVMKPRRHPLKPILWHATVYTPNTRSKTRWVAADSRGGLLRGEQDQASCLSSLQRRPIHRPLLGLGSRGRRLGVSSRELKPKLERLQRPAGIHSLLVYRIDNAIAAACRRKEASFCMLPQIDRRGGSRGRKPL